ncbi:M23 family metallopeptidase [Devosia riboflavina]|uniref:M23 family metallopeptidase n=1 Tax=Devosia riboflavina TaxID=46914 RepID=UPI00068D5A96|nr:M23 family metallopeptidase [Devosia riboflavina]
MPASLGAPAAVQVAEQRFLPPAPIGSAWGVPPVQSASPVQSGFTQPVGSVSPIGMGASAPSVRSQDLPVLSSSASMGTPQAMPAMQTPASMPSMPPAVALGSLPSSNAALPVNSSVPSAAPAAAPVVAAAANTAGAYTHTIAGGESLYTIARRYEVTTQALVQANGLSSPDKIVVGQSLIIPGRPDLVRTPQTAAQPTVQVASATPTQTLGAAPAPLGRPQAAPQQVAATPASVAAPVAAPAPTQVASAPAAEPVASGNDKFRWPVSGRVITDFAASRGTGINIDVPEGSTVKAAENGTVIYVGSGVEGYGNLILIRHPNGYVSAYAHLNGMSVAKGATVSRGDSIGTVGMSGSVSKPQLHFELRKGATPVDPVPLLAS